MKGLCKLEVVSSVWLKLDDQSMFIEWIGGWMDEWEGQVGCTFVYGVARKPDILALASTS